ncbi:hypothetical protein Tco_0731410 [Tanacetum coccineum]
MVKIHTDKNIADLLTKAFDLYLILLGKAKKSVKLMMEKLFRMELELMLVPQPSDPIENVADEAVHKELGDSLVRAATTAYSLEAEQDNGNINKTQSKATPNESSSLGTTSGGGPRCQETIGDTIAQIRVLDLEKTKTTQQNKIASLKKRVKKLKKKYRSRTHKLKRLYQVGLTARVESSDNKESLGEDASKQGKIDAIDADEEITMEVFVAEQEVAANKENDEVNVVEEEAQVSAAGNVVSTAGAATIVSAATITTDYNGDITLAQALIEMKSTKPKVKGVVIQELAERLAREKAEKEKEANIALIESWDDIQANINADYQLAERLQAQEQEELSVEEKARLFQQLLEKRRKHFAAKRAEEKRNKPPRKAQQRQIMCTYLKNMEGYKLKDLKLKEFDSIQKMFDRAFQSVNIFEDFRTELVEGNEKRAGTELIQEITKKQKVEDDKETTKLKHLMLYLWLGDLEDLYKLVKAKYESTRPVEDLDLLLLGDLKTMFEPHVEDAVWRNQQAYKVLDWKLYDSYRGRIVGIKSLLDAVRITTTHVFVNAAQLDLVLLMDFKENMLNGSVEVNAASEKMLEVTTASEYQVNAAS